MSRPGKVCAPDCSNRERDASDHRRLPDLSRPHSRDIRGDPKGVAANDRLEARLCSLARCYFRAPIDSFVGAIRAYQTASRDSVIRSQPVRAAPGKCCFCCSDSREHLHCRVHSVWLNTASSPRKAPKADRSGYGSGDVCRFGGSGACRPPSLGLLSQQGRSGRAKPPPDCFGDSQAHLHIAKAGQIYRSL